MSKLNLSSCLKKMSVALLSFVTLSGAGISAVSANSIHTQRYSNHIAAARAVYHHMPTRVHLHRNSRRTRQKKTVKRMVKVAKSKLGDPYVFGANGPQSFDCSGFTKYVYQHGAKKAIPRTASQQFYSGKQESERHAKPGDLVFFGSSKANISHVGMYLGHDHMVDAQLRGVVIEKIHEPWWNTVGFARL